MYRGEVKEKIVMCEVVAAVAPGSKTDLFFKSRIMEYVQSPLAVMASLSSSDSTYGNRDSSSGWLLNAAHSL